MARKGQKMLYKNVNPQILAKSMNQKYTEVNKVAQDNSTEKITDNDS